ncbi:LysR substrate-binding domain-containing protein [Afifella sp. JA880]|uniref:LysR family transcriptional regulator n=1 Tax=Afifella sp. JA880 TaxID=2975280 RepID=UPI0021BB59E9|nr:LysR family transcriptional regulator [Afifella sp. JA880]MCT8266829.1 LysR substrate-binding domain-containing protein [Afifella sp. JA880]
MDLLALADFNLVARHGGFGKAARASGRAKATLSRRVAELEAALALRLFERGARDLKLTEEGRAIHERTSALLSDLEETTAAIASGGGAVRGRLRISAPLLFSQMVMGRLAAQLALRYPDLRLEVTSDDRPVDMIEEGYDLVIRVNPAPDESLVGRAFLRDRLVVAASPSMKQPGDGDVLPVVIHVSSGQNGTWEMATLQGRRTMATEPVLRLSSLPMVRDVILAGVGAAKLPISLVKRDFDEGRLVHWGDVPGSEIALWALYPSRRLLSARVSAFLDLLKEAFPTGSSDELAVYSAH